MPERGFDTGFWTEAFVLGLTSPAKLLFHYLGSNDHCNQAGVYRIAPGTIAFETGLPEADIPTLMKTLQPEVEWLPEANIVWIKNFIAKQAKSPKFLVAAAKCLKQIRNNGLVDEVLKYNQNCYTISIPYEYSIGSVPILPVSVSVSKSSTGIENRDTVQEKGKSKVTEAGNSEPADTVKELFDLWNSLGVIKHKKLTGDMQRAITATQRDFSVADISQAMKNYATIVNDEQCFFKYRWTIQDFLRRGLSKFLELEVALNNYRRSGTVEYGSGQKQRKQPGQVPTAAELDQQERERGLR